MPIDWIKIPQQLPHLLHRAQVVDMLNQKRLASKLRSKLSQSACKGMVYKFVIDDLTPSMWMDRITYDFTNCMEFFQIDKHEEEVINNIKFSLRFEELKAKNLDEQLQDIV